MLIINKQTVGFAFCLWSIALIILAGCSQAATDGAADWKGSDVKLFDPLDAPGETSDITVVSARTRSGKLEIRLELLNVPDQPDSDIWILLSPATDRVSWSDEILKHPDLSYASASRGCLILFASSGNHRAWDAAGSPVRHAQLKALRHPILDLLDLSLRIPCSGISPASMTITLSLVPLGAKTSSDQAGPVNWNSHTPGKARVLGAFWNTFPAASPATALRAWDGAHGGYYGERHGLTRFLAGVKAYSHPIFLLDIKTPESLSAVDFVGGMELINRMVRSGQLFLPDAALPMLAGSGGPSVLERMLADSRHAGQNFGLRPSQIAYLASPSSDFPALDSHRVVLQKDFLRAAPASSRVTVTRSAATTRIIMPEPMLDQITRDGLSLQTRRQLIEGINQKDNPESAILLLGGDFANSAWSDEQAARTALEYLSVRPWIDWLTESDLLSLRAGPDTRNSKVTPRMSTWPGGLADNYSDHPAWFAYRSNQLTLGYPVEVAAPLHHNNQWLPESLALVSGESVSETNSNSCTRMARYPDHTICFLISPGVLAIINPANAGIFYLGVVSTSPNNHPDAGYAQIIGSSSQLALGFSDPSTWNLDAGVSADPAALPGGFVPDTAPVSIELTQAGLQTLSSIDLRYTLLADGIRVEGHVPPGVLYQTAIPLVVQPERRFHSGWAEQFYIQPIRSGFSLGWLDSAQVTVISNAVLEIRSFTDSFTRIRMPEDPDYEYPPGHFLPFPLVRLNLDAQSDFFIEIRYGEFNLPQGP